VSAGKVLGATLGNVKRFLLPIEGLATISFLTAYGLSSPRTRHPYLLYASLGGLGVVPYTRYIMATPTKRILAAGKSSEETNGEQVNNDLKEWQLKNLGRIAISG